MWSCVVTFDGLFARCSINKAIDCRLIALIDDHFCDLCLPFVSSWVFDKHTRAQQFVCGSCSKIIFAQDLIVCCRRFRHRLALAMNISHRDRTHWQNRKLPHNTNCINVGTVEAQSNQPQPHSWQCCTYWKWKIKYAHAHIWSKTNTATECEFYAMSRTEWNTFDHKLRHRYLNDPANERISSAEKERQRRIVLTIKPPTKTWPIMLSSAHGQTAALAIAL